ncbi:hypothetical protein V2G26_017076 [Clonostachys chloroleuca]
MEYLRSACQSSTHHPSTPSKSNPSTRSPLFPLFLILSLLTPQDIHPLFPTLLDDLGVALESRTICLSNLFPSSRCSHLQNIENTAEDDTTSCASLLLFVWRDLEFLLISRALFFDLGALIWICASLLVVLLDLCLLFRASFHTATNAYAI